MGSWYQWAQTQIGQECLLYYVQWVSQELKCIRSINIGSRNNGENCITYTLVSSRGLAPNLYNMSLEN